MTQIPTGVEGFGKRLRWLREKKKISRRVLADFIITSKNSVARYERGERVPDIAVVARMAEFFGVSLDWIISGK